MSSMNTQKVKDFLNDPMVKEAMEQDGIEEVARMASMAGVMEKDADLRKLAGMLAERAK
jgi:hypothetical protein